MQQFFALLILVSVIVTLIAMAKSQGAKEEREKIDAENTARLKRQNDVVAKGETRDDLRKSMEDGTF